MVYVTAGVVWVAAYWPAFIQHPEAQQTTQVGVWLRLVLLPVILLAGFLGNGLTVALMRRPGMRRNSYSPYLTALAACDSVALLVRLAFWLNLLASTLQRSVLITFRSLVACALVEYVCTTNHVLCSWLVVVLTVERLVVVVLPLKSARFVTSSNSVKVRSLGDVIVLFVGCLTLQQRVSVFQRRICSDNYTCCHTHMKAADRNFLFHPVTVH